MIGDKSCIPSKKPEHRQKTAIAVIAALLFFGTIYSVNDWRVVSCGMVIGGSLFVILFSSFDIRRFSNNSHIVRRALLGILGSVATVSVSLVVAAQVGIDLLPLAVVALFTFEGAKLAWLSDVIRSPVLGPWPPEAANVGWIDERVFISYRRSDAEDLAERIEKSLTRLLANSEKVFRDKGQILPGSNWDETIRNRINEWATVLLLVVSPDFAEICKEKGRRRIDDVNDVVRRELELALAKGIFVLPVVTEGARMPEKMPEILCALAKMPSYAINTKDEAELERAIARIFEQAVISNERHLSKRVFQLSGDPDAGQNFVVPYPVEGVIRAIVPQPARWCGLDACGTRMLVEIQSGELVELDANTSVLAESRTTVTNQGQLATNLDQDTLWLTRRQAGIPSGSKVTVLSVLPLRWKLFLHMQRVKLLVEVTVNGTVKNAEVDARDCYTCPTDIGSLTLYPMVVRACAVCCGLALVALGVAMIAEGHGRDQLPNWIRSNQDIPVIGRWLMGCLLFASSIYSFVLGIDPDRFRGWR